jgi:hypothetical protein
LGWSQGFGQFVVDFLICQAYWWGMQQPRFASQKPKFPLERFVPNPQLKFMEQCREVMRFRRFLIFQMEDKSNF